MKNRIYVGTVMHQRRSPKEHSFTYGVIYFFLDLSRGKETFQIPWFLSFKPENYLTEAQVKERLIQDFGAEAKSANKIFILTQLSSFGICFNPVSFYYIYDHTGKLIYILSQITNTPWGEKHINTFAFDRMKNGVHFKKDFHVSPFMPMNLDYHWSFAEPGETLAVRMSNQQHSEKKPFFKAEFNLNELEHTPANVIKSFFKIPCMGLKTIWGIYWQALRLYLKRIPFYTHPKKSEAI